MKHRLIILTFVILSLFTTNMVSAEEKVAPVVDNEATPTKITKLENIESSWFTESYVRTRNMNVPFVSIYKLQERMGAEPYWRMGKNKQYYAIYRTDEKHYLFMTFSGIWFADGWYVSKMTSDDLFKKYVKKGGNLDVVKLIDPDTIAYIYEKNKMESYHHLNDGIIASIYYIYNGKEWIIDRIEYVLDETEAVSNLLDMDYNLIKNDNNPNEETEFLEKLKKLNEAKNTPKDEPIKKVVNRPAKVVIKSAKHTKKKSIRISIKKAKYAKKYQVQYATNRKFKKAKIKTISKTKFTIKVNNKKNYYIRVRGINKTKKGKWSKVKKIKLQK